MTKKTVSWDKEDIMKRHDFNYIREHFFDFDYSVDDLISDIVEIYQDNLDLTQLSAEGKNTTRVTNYFVQKTQFKATTIRAKMSPYRALYDDDALCEIINKIERHPHFFNMRATLEDQLKQTGVFELLYTETDNMSEMQKLAVDRLKEQYVETLNKVDIAEIKRAMSHTPAYGKVSQFPNHVAQRIYERYAPKQNGIILDSSAGWGNRMMAALSSKYHYKYLGTDPNSEMHPNYYAIAKLMYETLYKDNSLTIDKRFPHDFIDIRDQGSEFDVPEWHQNSGYEIIEEENPVDLRDPFISLKNKFTGEVYNLPNELDVPQYEAWGFKHPYLTKGLCDTGKLETTGAKLPPILQTHDPEIFNSGIGDLSFTSPPYFFLECYTEDSQNGDLSSGQSAGKGANYLQWVKDFMYPTIINHFNYLKPGGYYIYNLKDLPKDGLFLYSDWLSACLDVGFELIEQPEMILKARRQFGQKADGKDKIDFKGATEKIAVLRKPLTPTTQVITDNHKDALFHIQYNFNYPLIKETRPKGFESKLPKQIIDYLEELYKGKTYKLILKSHKKK